MEYINTVQFFAYLLHINDLVVFAIVLVYVDIRNVTRNIIVFESPIPVLVMSQGRLEGIVALLV
jgi:hypothetical protein